MYRDYSSSDEEETLKPYDVLGQWTRFWEEQGSLIKSYFREDDDEAFVSFCVQITFVMHVITAELLYHPTIQSNYYKSSKGHIADFTYPEKENVALWIRQAAYCAVKESVAIYHVSPKESWIEEAFSDEVLDKLWKKRGFKRFLRNIDSFNGYESVEAVEGVPKEAIEDQISHLVEVLRFPYEKESELINLFRKHLYASREEFSIAVHYDENDSGETLMDIDFNLKGIQDLLTHFRLENRHSKRRIQELIFSKDRMHYSPASPHIEKRTYSFLPSMPSFSITNDVLTSISPYGTVSQNSAEDYDALFKEILLIDDHPSEERFSSLLRSLASGSFSTGLTDDLSFERRSTMHHMLRWALKSFFISGPRLDPSMLFYAILMLETVNETESPYDRIDFWKEMLCSTDAGRLTYGGFSLQISEHIPGGIYAPTAGKDAIATLNVIQRLMGPYLPTTKAFPGLEEKIRPSMIRETFIRNAHLVCHFLKTQELPAMPSEIGETLPTGVEEIYDDLKYKFLKWTHLTSPHASSYAEGCDDTEKAASASSSKSSASKKAFKMS